MPGPPPSRPAPTSPWRGRASCASCRRASGSTRRPPRGLGDPAPRRPGRGQPSRRAARDADLAELYGLLHPGADLLVTQGAEGGLLVRLGGDGPTEIAPLPADVHRPGDRPDRRRRHVPGRAPGLDPATRGRRPSPVRATGSTCASRPPPDRSSSRARASTECRIGRPSSSAGRASGSVGRWCPTEVSQVGAVEAP